MKHVQKNQNRNVKLGKMQTRNAARCNNRDDVANHRFIPQVSVFSEAYLEPSRTSLMNLFAKIAESR